MHSYVVLAVSAAVRADTAGKQLIDVDAYCRRFAPDCPGLSLKELQEAILEVVASHGGSAVWGGDAKDISIT